jgi:RND family efflux transporter MFP subunit
VVREPQVRQAEAELEAARADLTAAELDLERTRVSLPFDGMVVSESVDPGLYVSPGRAVATVYGTRAVEIRVPLEDRELAWFEVPQGRGVDAPRADVSATFAGARHVWKGRVVRLEGQVDPRSRMVHVVVEVTRPFERREGRPPLLPGTFVEVSIHGKTLADVIPVPRHALHDDQSVWVVEDGLLRIRQVEVVRSDFEWVYVSSGLDSGARVVVSALDAVTDGMAVRTENGPPAAGVEDVSEDRSGGEA